ncbi:MAG: hemerythrin domain-containing protein [Patescibacteria group bacterium]
MKFIDELKGEHRAIEACFAEFGATDIFAEQKAVVQKLVDVALSHLKKEDEVLYPALANAQALEIKRLGDAFASVMKEYSARFVELTGQLLASESAFDPTLVTQFLLVRDRIKNRIVLEEGMLYPAYEIITGMERAKQL